MKIKEKGLTGKAAQFRKDLIVRRKFDAFRLTGSAPSSTPSSAPIVLEYLGVKLPVSSDGGIPEEDIPFVAKATLKFSGSFDNVYFNAIKEPLKDLFEGMVPYIKYMRGESSGLVGFHRTLQEEDLASVKKALATLEDKELTWEFVPGLLFP